MSAFDPAGVLHHPGTFSGMDRPYRTRAVVVALDPTPAQVQLLRSYCGSARKAYNWVLTTVKANLDTRAEERRAGVAEADLTKSLSWSPYSLTPLWNSVKDVVAPWHNDVTMHAFRSGVTNAATALKNFSESKNGLRHGRPMGYPTRKSLRSKLSTTFTDTKRSDIWFAEDSHHVRLILPRFATDPRIARRRDQLQWIHTTESLRRLKSKVASGDWSIQAVTISFTGGRWQASFLVRQLVAPMPQAARLLGPIVGVDLGVRHLATLSVPIKGISDADGHVANPRHLAEELERLAKLNRQLSKCVKGSKNRVKLIRRRQRLYGRVARTRNLYQHRLTTTLAGSFETVVLEDLGVTGMVSKSKSTSTHGLSRSILDVGFFELRRQLTYKSGDRDHRVMVIDRFYPTSKMCSSCGETKAKLALHDRIFECGNCGLTLDRDVNAARNIHREGLRLLGNEVSPVAGYQPETLNADSRDHETEPPRWGRRYRYQSRTTQPLRELSRSV
jgi:putative transposase